MSRLPVSLAVFRVVATCLALLCCSGPAQAAVNDRAGADAEISGLIQLYGCPAEPDAFLIQAVPVGVELKNRRTRYSDPRTGEWTGTILPTGNPRILTFSIRGLKRDALYQLGLSVFRNLTDLPADHPLAACRKIFWRGPERGLVVAGSRPVLFEGFVARTELEVRSSDGYGRQIWLGKDDLRFDDDELAIRTFRWRSTLPAVTGIELQVSTEAFPTGGDLSSCEEPVSGMVARIWQAARGNAGDFQETSTVDFRALLLGSRSDIRDPAGDAIGAVPPDESALAMLNLGAPLYVRAVPHTEAGPACDTDTDGVAGWVMMAKLPADFDLPPDPAESPYFEPWDGSGYEPPYLGQPAYGHPAYGELAYMVIKNHPLPTAADLKLDGKKPIPEIPLQDPLGYLLVSSGLVAPGTVLTEGTWFVFKPQPSSSGGDFISDFSSAIGGLGGAFGGLVTAAAGLAGSWVDYMHRLTEQIKSSLAEAVVDIASSVPGVEAFCGKVDCEEYVKKGMEYGLVSMGVPPTLPSWTELKEQGASYLAAQVSSAIGDPTDVTEKLTKDQLLDMVEHTTEQQTANRGGDDPRYDWVVPYLGFEPAIWTISVKKNVPGDLPKNVVLRIKPTSLFAAVNLRVPYRFLENETLMEIPVVLPPNTSGIATPRCTTDPYWQTNCVADPSLSEPLCIGQYADANGVQSVELPCEAVNHPGIYYREAWLQQRFWPSSCVLLNAVSYTDTGSIYLLLEPPFKAAAALDPAATAAWDGAIFNNCTP